MMLIIIIPIKGQLNNLKARYTTLILHTPKESVRRDENTQTVWTPLAFTSQTHSVDS